MRITLLLLFAFPCLAVSQPSMIIIESLLSSEVRRTFPEESLNQLGIDLPVTKAHTYGDAGGKQYILLAEDPEGKSLKAICVKECDTGWCKEWNMLDFVLPKGNEVSPESRISFLMDYYDLFDYDVDGHIDPILTYGTEGDNGFEDGRIKILVYYKGQKYAIRHQNGTLDNERNTQVDEAYYTLPERVQWQVTDIMKRLTKDNKAIFPAGWEKAMEEKKTYFDEN